MMLLFMLLLIAILIGELTIIHKWKSFVRVQQQMLTDQSAELERLRDGSEERPIPIIVQLPKADWKAR